MSDVKIEMTQALFDRVLQGKHPDSTWRANGIRFTNGGDLEFLLNDTVVAFVPFGTSLDAGDSLTVYFSDSEFFQGSIRMVSAK